MGIQPQGMSANGAARFAKSQVQWQGQHRVGVAISRPDSSLRLGTERDVSCGKASASTLLSCARERQHQ